MFLSFLKRERERTVNVPWTYRERTVNVPWTFSTIRSKALLRYDSNVPRRSWPFNVPDRSPFLTVTMTVLDRYHDRSWPFLTVPDRSWPFLTVSERSWPFLSVLDRFWAFLTVSERFRPFYERFRSFWTVLWVFSVICDLYGRFDHNNIHVQWIFH